MRYARLNFHTTFVRNSEVARKRKNKRRVFNFRHDIKCHWEGQERDPINSNNSRDNRILSQSLNKISYSANEGQCWEWTGRKEKKKKYASKSFLLLPSHSTSQYVFFFFLMKERSKNNSRRICRKRVKRMERGREKKNMYSYLVLPYFLPFFHLPPTTRFLSIPQVITPTSLHHIYHLHLF